jgi:GAF domain-containing protein
VPDRSPIRVAIVPHTHWDREWYAPFQTFRMRLVKLLDALLPMLECDLSYARFLLDGQTIVVDDVRIDPRYLACSLATRSEIVVPIRDPAGRIVGEIDIDSDQPAAFAADDRARVEAAAATLGRRFGAGR